jgi:hypothetical protein
MTRPDRSRSDFSALSVSSVVATGCTEEELAREKRERTRKGKLQFVLGVIRGQIICRDLSRISRAIGFQAFSCCFVWFVCVIQLLKPQLLNTNHAKQWPAKNAKGREKENSNSS